MHRNSRAVSITSIYSNACQGVFFLPRYDLMAEVNTSVLAAGKQKASGSSTDADTKLASTGLTEKQLQLSVEVCDNLHPPMHTRLTFTSNLLAFSDPATAMRLRPLCCVRSPPGADIPLVFRGGLGGRSQHPPAAV